MLPWSSVGFGTTSKSRGWEQLHCTQRAALGKGKDMRTGLEKSGSAIGYLCSFLISNFQRIPLARNLSLQALSDPRVKDEAFHTYRDPTFTPERSKLSVYLLHPGICIACALLNSGAVHQVISGKGPTKRECSSRQSGFWMARRTKLSMIALSVFGFLQCYESGKSPRYVLELQCTCLWEEGKQGRTSREGKLTRV